MKESLIEPHFLEQLEHVILASRRACQGLNSRSVSRMKRGLSSEFFDYRRYSYGDDLRYVDWKIYGRLERLFLKLFREEEEIDLHLLVDTSASMGIGEPPKIKQAVKLAAALALTGLVNHQRVGLAFLDSLDLVVVPPGRGKNHRQYLFRLLFDCRPQGTGDLAGSLYHYAGYCKRGGLAVVLSDMLYRQGIDRELDLLKSKKFDIYLFQILARQEIDPEIPEPVTLLEVETGRIKDLERGPDPIKFYQKKLHDFNQNLKVSCDMRKIDLLSFVNDEPLNQVILSLVRHGLLRKR